MPIVTIFNQKGGVSKTTTAVNLSVCLSNLGKNVLLIDMDPQGNAGTSLGVEISKLSRTVTDVLVKNEDVNDVVVKLSDNLDFIPANLDLSRHEVLIINKTSRELLLRKAIKKLTKQYDFILIDCPPNAGILSINALMASNYILIPVSTDPLALHGVSALLDILDVIRDDLEHPIEILGVLATKFDSRTNISNEIFNSLKEHFEGKVFKTIIPTNVKITEAPSFGQSIVNYAPNSPGSIAYEELAEEVLERIQNGV